MRSLAETSIKPPFAANASRWRRLVSCLRERRLPLRLKQIGPELLSKWTGQSVVFCRSGRKRFLKFKVEAQSMSDLILDEVFTSRVYFPTIDQRTEFKINRRDVVIDIGANVGLFAACAANQTKGKVYCFEPSQKNFAELERHRRINKLDNMILVNKGISDRSESTRLYLHGNNCGAHSVFSAKGDGLDFDEARYEEIECISLKQVFDQYHIERCDFLKIDCEGAEGKILAALPGDYYERITRIALEYHANVDVLALAELLDQNGFSVFIKGYPAKWGLLFAIRRPRAA
jgi:FkbM family methyltransferase